MCGVGPEYAKFAGLAGHVLLLNLFKCPAKKYKCPSKPKKTLRTLSGLLSRTLSPIPRSWICMFDRQMDGQTDSTEGFNKIL